MFSQALMLLNEFYDLCMRIFAVQRNLFFNACPKAVSMFYLLFYIETLNLAIDK